MLLEASWLIDECLGELLADSESFNDRRIHRRRGSAQLCKVGRALDCTTQVSCEGIKYIEQTFDQCLRVLKVCRGNVRDRSFCDDVSSGYLIAEDT